MLRATWTCWEFSALVCVTGVHDMVTLCYKLEKLSFMPDEKGKGNVALVSSLLKT